MNKRSRAELAEALRQRADLLTGERWEAPATQAMMREAADYLDQPKTPFTYPRDREGFALCHHGRRIACNECITEEEETNADAPQGIVDQVEIDPGWGKDWARALFKAGE